MSKVVILSFDEVKYSAVQITSLNFTHIPQSSKYANGFIVSIGNIFMVTFVMFFFPMAK